MFNRIREYILNLVTSRTFVFILAEMCMFGILLNRVFQLQIVNGSSYMQDFRMSIEKTRTIPATRGNIYDRNGELLAYDELAYSVTIEDVYESGRNKNASLNATIEKLITMVEANGDKISVDFDIILDSDGNYAFSVTGNALNRFRADVYGKQRYQELSYEHQTASAEEVMNHLCSTSRFGVGNYRDPDDRSSFVPGLGMSRSMVLKIVRIRYAMNSNSFQKYIATTVATNVNERTVAKVMENVSDLPGVAIAEDTIRKYNNAVYFSQIIGYTGRISTDELARLSAENPRYTANDIVGKTGIEASMESYLQGVKGQETVYVDNMGKVIEASNYTTPIAGNDIYLTVDADLQMAVYDILEQKIAGILLSKIRNVKEYEGNGGSGSIIVPIYDVYYALINNSVIDITRFDGDDASENERMVGEAFKARLDIELEYLHRELFEKRTPYSMLSKEEQSYQSYIVQFLGSKGVIDTNRVDTKDPVYISWVVNENISLGEYLDYTIAANWIDVSKLSLTGTYSDSDTVFQSIYDYLNENLRDNTDFSKRIYKYMLLDDTVRPVTLLEILAEQEVIYPTSVRMEELRTGRISAFDFTVELIRNLQITPAQLALDPCTGSVVITDVNSGQVLALVSYPSYDINKMANGVDATYFSKVLNDRSSPLINYATQQRTAPGSTFKMVSSVAAIQEGILGIYDRVVCHGEFKEVEPPPKCWIYPGAHGSLNVSGAIRNSCNYFFYDCGYKMSIRNGYYSSDYGLERLNKYASMFGLDEKSGVEIEEWDPKVSDADSVRSMIGQGTNDYTTAALARYVATVASNGINYKLTLLDKMTDAAGTLLEDYEPVITEKIEGVPGSVWTAIHQGMRAVVEDKPYFDGLGINVAGKTGTAQENRNRPNHALFVSYAPYETPEIAVACRVAFGYSSDYAAQLARDVIKYYYKLDDSGNLVNGVADTMQGGATNTD